MPVYKQNNLILHQAQKTFFTLINTHNSNR